MTSFGNAFTHPATTSALYESESRLAARTSALHRAKTQGRPVADVIAGLAADLDAWARLLGLHDDAELARAEPQTMRYCLWHLPARLISHARRRILKISATWPWNRRPSERFGRLTVPVARSEQDDQADTSISRKPSGGTATP